ncbi:MAG: response regulator [Novosphingobium sp.]
MRDVLIVEDELLVALDLEDILTSGGFDVVGIVADRPGADTINTPPVVALVDLNLRDGPTGNDVARHLASQFGTRIIFVTANPAQIADPPETAIGYVQKPFRPETIVMAVQEAIRAEAARGNLRVFN